MHGLTFVINWDSSVGSAPSSFVSGIELAANNLLNSLSGPLHATTIKLNVGWGEVAGSPLGLGALGESETYIDPVGYGTLQSALNANLPAADLLPASDPLSGTHTYWVATSEEKALGLPTSNPTVDGDVGFGSSYNWNYTSNPTSAQYDFVGVAEHEISETMGRIALIGGSIGSTTNSYSAFDLFRFSSPGIRSPGASSAFFSYNGSNSTAANAAGSLTTNFNTVAGGDPGDWASSAGNDAFNAFSSTGALKLSGVDIAVLNALGYGRPA